MPQSFSARLLRWFDAEQRDLPWRWTRDPWAIWVSEVMLQQTRVAAVIAAYQRFVARYPTPAAWAVADDDELQAAWRGLGYYRRARLLRDGARAVVEQHQGRVPAGVEALGALPGIGAYTRGAVASIAFGLVAPAIDGNVERVLARHLALRQQVKSPAVRALIQQAVLARIDRARPGDFNQALMELGAIVCTKTAPACDRCPVAGDCAGRRAGIAAGLPRRPPRRAPIEVAAAAVFAPVGAGVLGARIAAGAVNAGQVELPGKGLLQSVDAADLGALLRAQFGCELRIGEPLCRLRHTITWHRITLTVHAATVVRRGRLRAFAPADPAVPWSTASRKVFARLLGNDAGA